MRAVVGFGRSLGFAVLVALAAPLVLAVLSPALGSSGALAAYTIAATAAYLFALARRPSSGLAAAGAVLTCGTAGALLGAPLSALVVLCAVLLGVLRSGLLRRDPRSGFGRAFAIEVALIGGGLVLGGALGSGSFFPVSAALWGFFLVQSGFFLIGGPEARAARDTEPTSLDPFERAQRRAQALLDEATGT